MRYLLLFALALLVPAAAADDGPLERWLSEVVSDPQSDWSGDGRVTASDEFVELRNPTDEAVDVTGWELEMEDSTPESTKLQGVIPPDGYHRIDNPPGAINNEATLRLRHLDGTLLDTFELRHGNAEGVLDEATSRHDGIWQRRHATPGTPNAWPSIRFSPYSNGSWINGSGPDPIMATLVDADQRIDAVHWTVGNEAFNGTLEAVEAGVWSSSAPTSSTDASTWQIQVLGHGTALANVTLELRRDTEAPRNLSVTAPAWTNATSVDVQLHAASDDGSGDISYSVTVDGGTVLDRAPSPSRVKVPVTVHGSVVVFVARDAVGNEARLQRMIGYDATPPSAPINAAIDGEGRLIWGAAVDNESGVAVYEIQRGPDPQRTVQVEALNSSWTDPWATPGKGATFSIRAIDGAQNVGPPTFHETRGRPLPAKIQDVRLSRPVWGPGVLTVWWDFVSPMDASQEPDVVLLGERSNATLHGRWLANASTYRVDLDESWRPSTTSLGIELRNARTVSNGSLAGPHATFVAVDSSPPLLERGETRGWIGPEGLALKAVDAEDPDVMVRWRTGEQWTEVRRVARLPAETTTVEAYAIDHAGWKSPLWKATLRFDGAPPTIEVLASNATQVRLAFGDNGSGVLGWRADTGANGTAETPAVPFNGNGTVTIEVWDRAGNRANRTFVASLEQAGGKDEPSRGADEQPLEVGLPLEPSPSRPRGWLGWAPVGAVALGGGSAAAARRLRRRRPTRS